MYQKQTIFPNTGLAINPQPDAIQDGQASDILNLRFDKLGYMVNRNGVRAFDFVETTSPTSSSMTPQVRGCIGIGEFILSEPVTDEITFNFDQGRQGAVVVGNHGPSTPIPYTAFDRFMVFALRTTGNRCIYYLVPNTEFPDDLKTLRVQVATNNNDVVFFCRPEKANGSAGVAIVAPTRRLSRSSDGKWVDANGTVDDTNWIDHYQDFVQYNSSLVICDPINGDVFIRDSWDDAETGDVKEHHLRLQENVKAFFDVDIVRYDPRLASGEENGSGIEHGMGLYKLYLPKKSAIIAQDGYTENFIDQIGAPITFPTVSGYLDVGSKFTAMLNESTTFMKGINASVYQSNNFEFPGAFKALLTDRNSNFVYSTYKQATTIDSLLQPVSFHNPALERRFDDKGNEIIDDAADVFIWNEVRLTYYPSSGKLEGQNFLRGADRDYSKTIPINPKIVRTKTRTGVEQQIPLGIRGYRFVWDMGNGEYSAPSSVLQIPDMLWSALPDEDLLAYGDYKRFRSFSGTGAEAGYDGGVNGNELFSPYIVDTSTSLLSPLYTEIYQKVRAALYDGNEFGDSGSLMKSETLITVYHPQKEITLEGIICDAANIKIKVNEDTPAFENASVETAKLLKITVPLNKNTLKGWTLNSIFSDASVSPTYGQMRKAFAPESQIDYALLWEGNSHPFAQALGAGQWVLEGYCSTETAVVWTKTQSIEDLEDLDDEVLTIDNYDHYGIRNGKNLYFNLVREFASDHNNTDENSVATVVRFVTSESDRLSIVDTNSNAEAVDRLLAEGIAEFVLAGEGDRGVLATQAWHTIGTILLDTYTEGNLFASAFHRTWTYDANGAVERETTTADASRSVITLYDSFEARLIPETGLLNDTMYYGSRYRKIVPHPSSGTVHPEIDTFNNLTIALHLPGDRLLLPEQITSYFPSSLLFKAPRGMLKIQHDDIPTRAKKLMIFRTLASHDNEWQPDQFGLVDTVDVVRVSGTPNPIAFFDDVKDEDIDFTQNPNEFDGLIHPLKSHFAMPLNERMYYANFEETYQPYAPRAFVVNDYEVNVLSGTEIEVPMTRLHPNALKPVDSCDFSFDAGWKELTVPDTVANRELGYSDWFQGKTLAYFVAFRDQLGEYSALKAWPGTGSSDAHPIPTHFLTVDFSALASGTIGAIGFMLSGYPYQSSLEAFEIFRTEDGESWYKIGEIKPEDEGVFVDTGLDAKNKWQKFDDNNPLIPYSPPKIDKYIDSVRWSEIYDSANIKYSSVESFLLGDGEGITGMVPIDGSPLIFKERSIIRAMTGGGTEIVRRDIVSNQYGCIAPQALLAYDETAYFLSWHGLMRYNNTGIVKADGAFAHELDERLREEYLTHRNPAIRDASMALNPVYRELYLNIPTMTSGGTYDVDNEGLKGHVYVINLDTNLATKYSYEVETTRNPGDTWDRTQGRLYHANSYGQLWSADQLSRTTSGTVSSFVYQEAPTSLETDDFQPTYSGTENVGQIVSGLIQTWWRSKKFSFGDMSVTKRVRKVYAKVTEGKSIRLTMESDNADYGQVRSGGSFFTTGELEMVPPFTPGADRGEGMTFEIASEGKTEIQNLSIIWRAPNPYVR